jgi:hypothetical protein
MVTSGSLGEGHCRSAADVKAQKAIDTFDEVRAMRWRLLDRSRRWRPHSCRVQPLSLYTAAVDCLWPSGRCFLLPFAGSVADGCRIR